MLFNDQVFILINTLYLIRNHQEWPVYSLCIAPFVVDFGNCCYASLLTLKNQFAL